MGLAACAMALAPVAAFGAFGDVSPQGYLPGGGAALRCPVPGCMQIFRQDAERAGEDADS